MLLAELETASRNVAATRSRLQKRRILAELLSSADHNDVMLVVNYLCGTLPQGRIGLGPAILNRVRKTLDAGGSGGTLSLRDVNACFDRVAETAGKGATARRERLLAALLDSASDDERSFLLRLILGELRQGALEAVLLESIAEAAGVDDGAVRRAAMLSADPAAVAGVAFNEGDAGLASFRLEPMTPVRAMLAQPAESIDAAFDTIPEAIVDYKLDGARVQIHKLGGEIRMFSRQLNDVTHALPEIVDAVRDLRVDSTILDGEVIALKDDGRPHPFQVTMRRFGRKHPDDRLETELPLSVFLFDCLYLNGAELIDRPLAARLDALSRIAGDAMRVPQLASSDTNEAAAFMSRALNGGHEGVMVKNPESLYAAGNRGSDWLKVKHAHTLDLVVLAAEWGSGRRKGYLSNLHLGARDGDDFVMLGKTFKGLTDKTLRWQTAALLQRERSRDDYTVYVRPELVVEIALNEIQASSQYPAGMALRFARVKRYRDDKPAAEADTIETVRQLFNWQTQS
ncbi:MAG: ATP-dependent DNA ligase [Pseudomonadota bacterium]